MRPVAVGFAALGVVMAVGGPAWPADPSTYAPTPPYVRPPLWFVEGNAGGSWGRYDSLTFFDPIDIANGNALGGATSGTSVILTNQNRSGSSVTGGASFGYFFAPNIFFAAVNYQHFGSFQASGFALFPAGNVRQDFKTSADGLLVSLGADLKVVGLIFMEPTVAAGAGFMHSTGVQGANLGMPIAFPSHDYVNFIAGAGLGVGSHLTPNFDILLKGDFTWLGRTNTTINAGITGTPPPPTGMNPGEQLQGSLGVFTLTGGARLKF
jgi:hypothetical protein